jgi:branched-chain amino acid transport system permease protein
MDSSTIVLLLLNGLYYAFALFLIALGLNILYSLMKILNIGHGGFYAMGAFLCWFLMNKAAQLGYPIYIVWLCIPAAALIVGLTGFFFEPVLFKRLYPLREEYSLLATFGLMSILDDVLRMIFGGYPLSANQLINYIGTVTIMGKSYPAYNLVIYIVAASVALGVWGFFFGTKIGRIVRGTAQDKAMASSLGVNSSILYTQTFFIAIFIAGLGGAIYLPATSAYSGMGFEPIVLSFAVMIIGGLGSIRGALVAAITIGLVRAFGIALIPQLELAFVFLILVITLIFRPRGMFGKKFTREEK